jgi:hypothetical protein
VSQQSIPATTCATPVTTTTLTSATVGGLPATVHARIVPALNACAACATCGPSVVTIGATLPDACFGIAEATLSFTFSPTANMCGSGPPPCGIYNVGTTPTADEVGTVAVTFVAPPVDAGADGGPGGATVTSGEVTVSSSDTTQTTGTFSLSLHSGGSLSGTFDATSCARP